MPGMTLGMRGDYFVNIIQGQGGMADRAGLANYHKMLTTVYATIDSSGKVFYHSDVKQDRSCFDTLCGKSRTRKENSSQAAIDE